MIDFSKCPNCKGDWIWEPFTRKRVCSNDCRLFIYSITGEWVAKKFKNYFIRWDNRGFAIMLEWRMRLTPRQLSNGSHMTSQMSS